MSSTAFTMKSICSLVYSSPPSTMIWCVPPEDMTTPEQKEQRPLLSSLKREREKERKREREKEKERERKRKRKRN
jgi:hypothetical protein